MLDIFLNKFGQKMFGTKFQHIPRWYFPVTNNYYLHYVVKLAPRVTITKEEELHFVTLFLFKSDYY